MKPIIEINHVWKEYHKGIDRRYKSLRDTITSIPASLFGKEKEKFWALEDINFKLEAGESVGIIGRNGAGKSTLLKILSRITPPTKGEIILRGRVASLLEVGTGFHPELTGRENVFFNGSILGMKHAEIKSKFDEIVAFSGVESFIDTPLKHYSSGMQMRLAFAVAAHLDSEILLIDEVLAVGDTEFQKKCIGKMDEVSKRQGKTILLVSHDITNLSMICKKGIVLDKAKILVIDTIYAATEKYLQNNQPEIVKNRIVGNNIILEKFGFDNVNFKKETNSPIGAEVKLYFEFIMKEKIDGFSISIDIRNTKNELISHIINDDDDFYLETNKLTKYQIELSIKNINLINDSYYIDLWFGKFHSESLLHIERCLKLNITKSELLKRRSPLPKHSKVFLESKWERYGS